MELSSTTLKKFLIFPKMELSSYKIRKLLLFPFTFFFWIQVQKKNVSYTFHYKEAKFSKLRYFLIMIIKRFFSFYNTSFYTQPVYLIYLLKYFCNVHDDIVAFFLFFFRKSFISFTSFFCSFSLVS